MREKIIISSEAKMYEFGKQLAQSLTGGELVFLSGELGAGKTTLTRGILQGLGHIGSVKSPTFTLVEPYEHIQPHVYHFDLYRLMDSEELEFMGWRDYLDQHGICIIEWPERAQGYLPTPDIAITLFHQDVSTRIVFKNDFR